MRTLIICGDPPHAQAMEIMLRARGCQVDVAEDMTDAMAFASDYEYAVAIVGPLVVDSTPVGVVRALRRARIAVPLVVVSMDYQTESIVEHLNAGADDVVGCPYHMDVLMARLMSVIRRSIGQATPEVRVGNLVVSLSQRMATVGGRQVQLTQREYQMLELLAMRTGTTVSKDRFLSHLYGGMDEPEIKIIDVFVCKIRKKLRMSGCTAIVDTVWGRGYTMRGPSTEAIAA